MRMINSKCPFEPRNGIDGHIISLEMPAHQYSRADKVNKLSIKLYAHLGGLWDGDGKVEGGFVSRERSGEKMERYASYT